MTGTNQEHGEGTLDKWRTSAAAGHACRCGRCRLARGGWRRLFFATRLPSRVQMLWLERWSAADLRHDIFFPVSAPCLWVIARWPLPARLAPIPGLQLRSRASAIGGSDHAPFALAGRVRAGALPPPARQAAPDCGVDTRTADLSDPPLRSCILRRSCAGRVGAGPITIPLGRAGPHWLGRRRSGCNYVPSKSDAESAAQLDLKFTGRTGASGRSGTCRRPAEPGEQLEALSLNKRLGPRRYIPEASI